jgi:uncharacterized membrane protein YphA (DoxX/SURF4 family)
MKKAIPLILRLVVAGVFLQTLFFKFTGAAESRFIFESLHAEPWGRIGSGIVELIACILLFVPGKQWLGALLSLGTISGAILGHLFVLGIEVQGDGGLLFGLAVLVFASSLVLLWMDRSRLLSLLPRQKDSV